MEGQILTGRWLWCDQTLAQGLVSSFDLGESSELGVVHTRKN